MFSVFVAARVIVVLIFSVSFPTDVCSFCLWLLCSFFSNSKNVFAILYLLTIKVVIRHMCSTSDVRVAKTMLPLAEQEKHPLDILMEWPAKSYSALFSRIS